MGAEEFLEGSSPALWNRATRHRLAQHPVVAGFQDLGLSLCPLDGPGIPRLQKRFATSLSMLPSAAPSPRRLGSPKPSRKR
jgi:hypothetical protein